MEALQDIWSQFHDLHVMESLRALTGTENYKDADTFAKLAKEWATEFRKQTFDEDVIPYIHGLNKCERFYKLILVKSYTGLAQQNSFQGINSHHL